MVEKPNYMRHIVVSLVICCMYKLDKEYNVVLRGLYTIWRYFYMFLLTAAIIQTYMLSSYIEDWNIQAGTQLIMDIAIYIGGMGRVLYFYSNSDQAKAIIAEMNQKFVTKFETPFDVKLLDTYVSLSYKLSRAWQTQLPALSAVYLTLLLIYRARNGERELPIVLFYPYDWKPSPYYELTLTAQYILYILLALSFTNTDTFYMIAMILTTGQYDLLAHKYSNAIYTALQKSGVEVNEIINFKNMFNQFGDDDKSSQCVEEDLKRVHNAAEDNLLEKMASVMQTAEFNKNVTLELIECIEWEQFLLNFIKKAEYFMSPFLLIVIVDALAFLTLIAYSIITVVESGMLIFLIVQFSSIAFQSLVIMYFGQELTNQHQRLFGKFYEAPWYLSSPKYKKMHLIIQMNMSKPVIVKIAKVVYCHLPTFLSMMRTFMSYLTVLRQIGDN